MHKEKDTGLFVIDIVIALDKIKRYTRLIKKISDFEDNEITFDATIMQLEVIGESMKHILKNETYAPLTKKYWRTISDLRNVIAHEYFGIDVETIFKIVTDDIVTLRTDFFDFIKKIKNDTSFIESLTETKKDLKKMKRKESLACLKELEQFLKK
ncbi:MAG: HepT-like ribonuclease domain-containing protein [bacterium]